MLHTRTGGLCLKSKLDLIQYTHETSWFLLPGNPVPPCGPIGPIGPGCPGCPSRPGLPGTPELPGNPGEPKKKYKGIANWSDIHNNKVYKCRNS